MVNDRKGKDEEGITSSELGYILEVNKKAIEIQVEVAKQNEQIIDALEHLDEKISLIKDHQTNHIGISEDSKNDIEQQKEVVADIKKFAEETHKIIQEIEDKIEDIEKSFFRLVIILGGAGLGTLLTIIQSFMHK